LPCVEADAILPAGDTIRRLDMKNAFIRAMTLGLLIGFPTAVLAQEAGGEKPAAEKKESKKKASKKEGSAGEEKGETAEQEAAEKAAKKSKTKKKAGGEAEKPAP
jgi:hypothetical protein